MSQIERYGFHTIHDLDVPPVFSLKSNGNYVLYEAHRKREEELLKLIDRLLDSFDAFCDECCTTENCPWAAARALLDAAKEEKHV